jgi:HPt (histidine-containing phosphotransfer) domain-containing protein
LTSGAIRFDHAAMSEAPARVDWEQLDMIADGFTPDFVEIYREFEIDLPRILGETEKALIAGDAVATARSAHQAKGSAANFGFFGFSDTMARIETQAKAGNLADIAAELATARRLFADSLEQVKRERGI